MPATLPALNLIAEPGRRRATLDTAREIERRGFAGISVSSSFGNMGFELLQRQLDEQIDFIGHQQHRNFARTDFFQDFFNNCNLLLEERV